MPADVRQGLLHDAERVARQGGRHQVERPARHGEPGTGIQGHLQRREVGQEPHVPGEDDAADETEGVEAVGEPHHEDGQQDQQRGEQRDGTGAVVAHQTICFGLM